jgi:hypothetical protein
MSRKVKEVIRAARLRDELSFASFRHCGFTETGDAELTDREIMAQGRKATIKTPAEIRETYHAADCQRHQKAARVANERRTFVRMSSSAFVRMENGGRDK